MKIIGLTGGSGSGKSYVAKLFTDKGMRLIDADQICREIYEPGGNCLAEVQEQFGKTVFTPDGLLNRRALAKIVFVDREKLERLNQIVHKYILQKIENFLETFTKDGEKYIIIDAPQLFEAGLETRCDYIISVIAPIRLRIKRIVARDGISVHEAEARIAMQHDDRFFSERSDYVIDNRDEADTVSQVSKICSNIMEDEDSGQSK